MADGNTTSAWADGPDGARDTISVCGGARGDGSDGPLACLTLARYVRNSNLPPFLELELDLDIQHMHVY
jgi:hypothetical protein